MHPTRPDYDTKSDLHVGVSGKIVKWYGDKGYGFVQTDRLPEAIFFHISVLTAPEQHPQIGESITIKARYDAEKKRWTANQITSPSRQQAVIAQQKRHNTLIRPITNKLKVTIPIIVIWFIGIAAMQPELALSYAIISALTFMLYAWDKRCALNNSSRVPENSLHAVGLLGGWAGALLARYVFRHKTQKQPFVNIFWATVILNIAATIYFMPKLLVLLK